MGIHKFGKWVESTDRNITDVSLKINVKSIPTNVGCLFMDMNSVFHRASQLVYLYGKGDPNGDDMKKRENVEQRKIQVERKRVFDTKTAKELENEMLQEIVTYVMEVITKINPSDYVVLAVDGVAPMAKITQQRKRRYEKALEAKEDSKFDSNSISPGTELMMKIDTVIQAFIAHCIKTNQFNVSNIVYSSHLTAGEGEHKIFHMVRMGHIKPNPDKVNLVFGADSDLFMLTLLSDIPYLYLCREDFSQVYNIDAMRSYLKSYMTIKGLFEPDYTQVCRDFVLILFLVGNDFVPDTIYFYDASKTINDLITDYQRTQLILTDENGQIIWENFGTFLETFSKREKRYLENMVKKMDTYHHKFPILQECSTLEKTKDDLLETYDLVAEVDLKKYKKLWYERALGPMSELGKQIIETEVDSSKIDDMCIEYIKAFQWILQYYMKGQKAVSSRFVYIYHFNPMLSDLAKVIKTMKYKDMLPNYTDVRFSKLDPVITPIHQLIAIMPPKSWKFIPEPYRSLMPVRFVDICPKHFEIITEAKSEKDGKFMNTAIINIVDPVRIDRDIQDAPVPKKYQEQTSKFITVHKFVKPGKIALGIKAEIAEFEKNRKKEDKQTEFVSAVPNYQIEPKQTDKEIFEIDREAKVEPKSAAQIERIIRAKIKTRTIQRKEKVYNKAPNYIWTEESLI
jgi:5'-3' exonuclease